MRKISRLVVVSLFFLSTFCIVPQHVLCAEQSDVDKGLAKLATGEPQKEPATRSEKVESVGRYFYGLTLKMSEYNPVNIGDAFEGDVQKAPQAIAEISAVISSHKVDVGICFAILLVALFTEGALVYFIAKNFGNRGDPEDDEELHDKIFGALQTVAVGCVRLVLFAGISLVCFAMIYGDDASSLQRAVFYTLLLMFVLPKAGYIFFSLLFSPHNKGRRFFTLGNGEALACLRCSNWLLWLISLTLFPNVLLKHLGVSWQVSKFIIVCSASVKLVVIGVALLYYRRAITEFLQKRAKTIVGASRDFFVGFSHYWVVLSLIYLGFVWVLQVNSIYGEVAASSGSYYMSLAVFPIYAILVQALQWSITIFIPYLHLYEDSEDTIPSAEVREKNMIERLHLYVHPVIFVFLAVWLLQRWGYNVPFLATRSNAIFTIVMSLGVGLFCWHSISRAIEKKIAEEYAIEETDGKGEEDWDVDNVRGRGFTLLPIIRKVTGSFIFVAVAFNVLNSLGVNITALLAGAGVLGLALGFGAQKVVSDILSGFFYLMDDAFRVGEYVEAGTITGCVEKITLRNVLLRHHRGMLLIVPFSELGAVTNYMRGGIIEKFNLEFPYDADVNQIRKVIKKVGIAMFEEEEFAGDFIRPVKSQGVWEITNSIMVIRVKFTAKPGKHFVIRREAYRRITEALNSKGIYYAHKKVIVELPEGHENDSKLLHHAGAASLNSEESKVV